MVECSLINFNKKLYGKPKDFDFSTLNFITESLPKADSYKTIQLINTCLDKIAYFDLVVNLNSYCIIEDNIHKQQLQFEQKLQSNELFMNGKSYFDLKNEVYNAYTISVKNIEDYCNYDIKQNNVILSKGKYTSAISYGGMFIIDPCITNRHIVACKRRHFCPQCKMLMGKWGI